MNLLRPYCSVQQLRDFIENESASEDALITAINKAGRYMESNTDRNFWFNDYSTDAYSVRRSDVYDSLIVLPFEILTLTELTQDGEALVQGVEEDYFFEAGTRTINSTGTFGAIPYTGLITIKGTFGFVLDTADPDNQPPPTLPGDVNDAAVRLAAAFSGLWRKTTRGLDGTSETVTTQSVPPDVKKVLSRYNVSRLRAAF